MGGSTLCWNLWTLPQLSRRKQRNHSHSQDLEWRWQVAFYESSVVVLTVGKVTKDAEIKKEKMVGTRLFIFLLQCASAVSNFNAGPAQALWRRMLRACQQVLTGTSMGCPEHVPALPGKVPVEQQASHCAHKGCLNPLITSKASVAAFLLERRKWKQYYSSCKLKAHCRCRFHEQSY